jgi:hypothetical protein
VRSSCSVQAQQRDGVLEAPQDRLASIDFTFTGHRTERRSSFAGGAQPASSTVFSDYTNCIVTVLWADGTNRTPPLLFTFNLAFRRDRKRTARRDDLVTYLDSCSSATALTGRASSTSARQRARSARTAPRVLRWFAASLSSTKCRRVRPS